MSFKERLSTTNIVLANSRKDNYESCKQLSDCIIGGLSSKNKDEIHSFVSRIVEYKKELIHNDYRTFKFGNKTIRLDAEQYEVVTAPPYCNYRIIAGAGSGKTTTILCRVKFLIDNYVSPMRILIMSFNVDAAQSLRNRINELFGFAVNVDIRTIDSFCASIKWKYKDDKYYYANHSTTSLSELSIEGEQIMLKYGKEIAKSYQFVFFDEFQDVNNSQFNILKIFIENGSWVTVIGDDNQNIYQWRGSNNYYIINMDRILEGNLKTYSIVTNYRSNAQIVDMANSSIVNNKVRLDKKMKPMERNEYDYEPEGEIKLLIYKTKQSQFKFIVDTIKQMINIYGFNYDDFAILSRTSLYLKLAEEYLQKEDIPIIALLTDKTSYDDKKPIVQQGYVPITTIHRAKGLEWKVVFMVGLNDAQFPSHMNNNIKNIEEERRLFYVGITRPKHYLYFVTNSSEVPLTRFIHEVYDMHLDVEDHTGMLKNNIDIFGSNDKNDPKKLYGVIDVVKLLQGEQLRDMRSKKLIPDIQPNVSNLFDKKLEFNNKIKQNYFESDFGDFVDRIITRKIMINNKQEIRDTDTEYILNGIELADSEVEVYNKYNIEHLLLKYDYKIKDIKKELDSTIKDHKDLISLHKILTKLRPNVDVRRTETYPAYFLNRLKLAYERYINPKIDDDKILNDLYYVSLCRKFINNRRRLVYRDIFDLFIEDFEQLNSRIKQYADNVKDNSIKCKINTSCVYSIDREFVVLAGEIDAINSTTKTLIDFKCSESDFKIEWLLQLLIYYSLLIINEQIDIDDIENLAIFNILDGKLYEIPIKDINYDAEAMIQYIKELIEKDMRSERSYDKMDITFLQSYGKNIVITDTIEPKEDKYGFALLDNDNRATNYISFDVETGTSGVGCNSIIQIGYVLFDQDHNEIKKRSLFVKGRIVENRLKDIHGISSEYLDKHGEEFEKVMYEFLFDLISCKHIIGHNIISDIRHMRSNIEFYQIPISYDPFDGKIIHDTFVDAKRLLGKQYKLGDLYEYLYKEPMKNAHDALADANYTAKCYFALDKMHKDKLQKEKEEKDKKTKNNTNTRNKNNDKPKSDNLDMYLDFD